MARYSQIQYSGDTYGSRVRGDIPLSVENLGYWRNDQGVLLAKATVTIGPLPWFPPGTRLAVLISGSWFPPIPDKAGLKVEGVFTGEIPVDHYDNLLLAAFIGKPEDTDTPHLPIIGQGWRGQYTEVSLPPLSPSSVLYARAYTHEPFFTAGSAIFTDDFTDDFAQVQEVPDNAWSLPWDIRGEAWGLLAGNYGGTDSAIIALPATFYSGGDPYAALPYDIGGERTTELAGPTGSVMSMLGFLADTIQTEGALVADTIERLHPNMVLPLLRGFGLTRAEEAAMSDKYLSDRMKNLLNMYRPMQMGRGRAKTLCEYITTLSGYESEVVGMENLLLSAGDAAPLGGDTEQAFDGLVMGTGVMLQGLEVAAIPTVPLDDVASWWFGRECSDQWADNWTVDPWIDLWIGWDTQTGPPYDDEAYGAPILQRSDAEHYSTDWLSESDYTQHLDWTYRLRMGGSTGGWMGTPSTDTWSSSTVFDTRYCEPIVEGDTYRFRGVFRNLFSGAPTPGEPPEDVRVGSALVFVDADGVPVGNPTYDVGGSAWTWGTSVVDFGIEHRPEVIAEAPEGAKFIAWRVSFSGGNQENYGYPYAKTRLEFGALELRNFGTRTQPFSNIEDLVYRDPRSLLVVVHTPYLGALDYQGALMEDVSDAMESTLVLMDDASKNVSSPMEASDAVVLSKIKLLMHDYLPHTVNARIVSGYDAEYARLFPERARVAPVS